LNLTRRFALGIAAFAIFSGLSAVVIWTKINDLQQANADIINRQYPARLAIAEAKGSSSLFTVLAYRLQDADKQQARELAQSAEDEAKRFRNWMQIVAEQQREAGDEITGIEERFGKLLNFLRSFAKPAAANSEARDFQLEYRFGPLRDDLEASLNHLSNGIGRATQDNIEYTQNIQSRGLLVVLEVLAAGDTAIFLTAILWASFRVARPLLHLAESMRCLALAQLDTRIEYTNRADEVGTMARAILVFRDNAIAMQRLEQEKTAAAAEAEAVVALERQNIVAVFEKDVMEVVSAVTMASSELERNASFMREMATATDTRAQEVVQISNETLNAVHTLSSSSEVLLSVLDRMNRQLFSAAEIALLAAADAKTTSLSANELTNTVDAIGRIADFIGDVAYQTNLLALNATIEAARCGEQGRGFAVVAGEVKHLAHETARAASDIARQIAAVRTATEQVVKSIDVTVKRVGKVAALAGHLETAADQRDRACRDIQHCVTHVATDTQNLFEFIRGIGRSTEETQRVAGEMLLATGALSLQAERLLGSSHNFCEEIRSSDRSILQSS
jgi:methyl-accepting chemotaxis protein